jgi:hypothetical protein
MTSEASLTPRPASIALWCAACESLRRAVRLRDTCWWCGGELVLPTRPAPAPAPPRPRRGKPRGKHRRLTDDQVRAAYRLHIDGGLSIRELGRRLYERYGYTSAHSCSVGLCGAFEGLGLQARDRVDAVVLAVTTHGLRSRGAPSTPEYLALRNARREHRPRCAGVKTAAPGKGRPCRAPAMAGSRFCAGHDPDRAAEREAHMAAMRARAGRYELASEAAA